MFGALALGLAFTGTLALTLGGYSPLLGLRDMTLLNAELSAWIGSVLLALSLVLSVAHMLVEMPGGPRAPESPVSDAIVCGLGTAFFGMLVFLWMDALLDQPVLMWLNAAGVLYLLGAFIGAFFTRRPPDRRRD